ncbi:MAG TPA: hypothetical protein VIX86_21030 [Streptosporangiaceae bacterium]
MKGNLAIGIAAVVLAAGAALGVAALRTVGASPAALSALPVAYNGVNGWTAGRARPSVIYIGQSDVFVRTPDWGRWSGTSAQTKGELWVNTCSPSCAAGHYRTYSAVVSFWRVAVHGGARYFSRLRLVYRHGTNRDYAYRWGALPGATLPGWNGGPG